MATLQLLDTWHRLKSNLDTSARDELIVRYARLVNITVGRVVANFPAYLDREDLVSAGSMGLIKAVDQFDIDRGVKFETYAIALIRGAILEMMRDQDWVPRSIRDHIKSVERALAACELELGRPPVDSEIAAKMGVSLDQYHRILSETGRTTVVSLDEILIGADDGDGVHLGDALADASLSTISCVERSERRRRLAAAIRKLPPREKTVICLYYKDGLTFREIGQVLVISESRAFQLHSQAVTRMRKDLTEHATLF